MPIMDLAPYWVSRGGSGLNYEFSIVEHSSPYVFGGPAVDGFVTTSMQDDSDGSYVQLRAWQDVDANKHADTISGLFRMPAGRTPTALLLKIRARNSSDVLASPPAASTRLLMQVLDTGSAGTTLDSQAIGNNQINAVHPLLSVATTDPTWFHWYWNTSPPDLNNPTDAGNWLELAWAPEIAAALTGGGLRVSLGIFWGAPGVDVPRKWLDLFEFRLLVAYTGSRRREAPLRVLQRGNDGLGISGGRRVIQSRTRQASNRAFGIR